jgi:hypothetical protein
MDGFDLPSKKIRSGICVRFKYLPTMPMRFQGQSGVALGALDGLTVSHFMYNILRLMLKLQGIFHGGKNDLEG